VDGWLDRRTRWIAGLAIGIGLALSVGLEWLDEPASTPLELVLELVKDVPIVVATVGVVLLFVLARRQRDDQRQLLRDLEIARLQGRRWRKESRDLLNGLGQAIEAQFSRWSLTQAEREVALLLLKGLSTKEIAEVRGSSERTVREQARAVYAKSSLTGRAALSAFFLEDLLAPVESLPEKPADDSTCGTSGP
jgi:DNA-binding CsgD family transcriptional regulator